MDSPVGFDLDATACVSWSWAFALGTVALGTVALGTDLDATAAMDNRSEPFGVGILLTSGRFGIFLTLGSVKDSAGAGRGPKVLLLLFGGPKHNQGARV